MLAAMAFRIQLTQSLAYARRGGCASNNFLLRRRLAERL